MRYRREIDGLRALAVVPVILFHAGFTVFSGGYVGVDVFFVISGYLITGIIVAELDQDDFSILRFYERRARRILPALFFVMMCCVPFAWIWMLPSEFKDFSESLIAVSLFASNVLFWRESGYFEAAAEEKPLLHTWSLAVEEQYYVIFPIALLLMWRFGRNPVFYGIIAVSALSLLLSEWALRTHPSANFYLAPTRAWELLAGSICAFLQFGKPQRSNNFFSAFGLALILFSIFFYDKSTPFPSVYALVPVAGTALIILYGAQNTWAARLLSLKVFVGIGLISYSAYLWHQPLFAFARIRSIYAPEQWLMFSLAIASLALAYLSWRFVEQPFRQRRIGPVLSRRAVFSFSLLGMSAFIAFGLFGHATDGLKFRLPQKALLIAEYDGKKNPADCLFFSDVESKVHPLTECSDYAIDGEFDVVFIGDSHLHTFASQAQELLFQNDISSYSAAFANCIGLPGYERSDLGYETNCSQNIDSILKFSRGLDDPVLVISSRFTLYWSGLPFDNGEGGVERFPRPVLPNVDLAENVQDQLPYDDTTRRKRVLESYTSKIRQLADEFKIILVYPIPEAGWNVPKTMFKMAFLNGDDTETVLSTSYEVFQNRNIQVIEDFDAIDHANVFRIKPHELLCNTYLDGRCLNGIDDQVYYYDDDHLSPLGGDLLAPVILDKVKEILRATVQN